MVGDQIDVMLQEALLTLLHPTGNCAVLAAPKQSVVHKNRIGFGFDRCIYKCATGRHAGHDVGYVLASFYLQTIGAVVFEVIGLQHAMKGI